MEGDVEPVVQAHGSKLRLGNIDDHITLLETCQFQDRLAGRDGLPHFSERGRDDAIELRPQLGIAKLLMRLGKAGRRFGNIGLGRLQLLFGKIVIGNACGAALHKLSLARFCRRGVLELRLGVAQIGFCARDREPETKGSISATTSPLRTRSPTSTLRDTIRPSVRNARSVSMRARTTPGKLAAWSCSAAAMTTLTGRGLACSPATEL